MTPAAFINWLASMKEAGLARSDAAAARLLGVSANAVVAMKRKGRLEEPARAEADRGGSVEASCTEGRENIHAALISC